MILVLLFAAALVGGALNAVAGGGSFIALPALMWSGVGAVSANATTTLALWPGSAASVIAYRREVGSARRWLVSLGAVSLIGGLLGSGLLVRTSDTLFLRLLPWLMLAAVVTFTFGGSVTAGLRALAGTPQRNSTGAPPLAPSHRAPLWILALQLVIGTYGGYFGGGMGIMMLAALSVAGMTDIHEMNGVKTALAVAINGMALVAFAASSIITWTPGLVMVAGGMLGGYSGAALARRVDPRRVRVLVMVVGWVMTGYFFVR